jgi:preprotein translocase subunit SecA
MLNFFTKLFGTKSQRDLKKLHPYIDKINASFIRLQTLTHDELRGQTQQLKHKIQTTLQPLSEQIQHCQHQADTDVTLSLDATEELYNQVANLEQQYVKELEQILYEILPEAFAIVKETARRFSENSTLVVTAQDYDQALADQYAHVTIIGDQAIWNNQWEVAGHMVTWDMVHYDEQLIGGIILHQGKIAEMSTGEGKTLVATLPAFLNALAGKGLHIVTVNDYLAKRDAAWMGPIYQFHGLQVDCIEKHLPYSPGRRAAYQADITYGTNNEFGFDYLRDNMVANPEDLVQRAHHYAIVDEVDSVLIDDARTPLIISGPVENSNEQEYMALKPRVQQLYEAQRQLVAQFLQEAKQSIAAGKTQEGSLAVFRAYRGLPKYKPLIKYLSEPGIKQLLHQTENYYIQDNSRMMPEADAPLLFTIDEQHNTMELTEKGLEQLTKQDEDQHFFVLPDTGASIAQIENDPSLDLAGKATKKTALIQEYATKSQRIHTIHQLLKAYALFEKDVDYILANSKVKIVDEQTGRVLEGRRYSDGLHQAIEAKEGVKIEKSTQTYATITLQNYFRMYYKLAGMTGTAETEAGEFWDIYQLDVVITPTHKPVIRLDKDDKIFKTVREKFSAVIDEISSLIQQDRPVLVGTTSVETSELVSRLLTLRKIKHQVLNAKYHQKEAEIVAEAGKPATVTIATNMAGRGTDIKLTPESKAAGGLAIIGTERHESRRIDRQLRGRAGRQGDPGSSQFFVSLEDDLMRLFISDRIAKIMDRLGLQEGEVIQHRMVTNSIQRAQKKVEQNNYGLRKRLLEYDNEINKQREVIYQRRRDALFGSRIRLDIMNMLHHVAQHIAGHAPTNTSTYDSFQENIARIFGLPAPLSAEAYATQSKAEITEALYQALFSQYQLKHQKLQQEAQQLLSSLDPTQQPDYIVLFFTEQQTRLDVVLKYEDLVNSQGEAMIKALEKTTIITFIDQYWQEHLRHMDDLRQSVQNAIYEQKDPLLIYKFEAYTLFQTFIQKLNEAITGYLLKANLQSYRVSHSLAAQKISKLRLEESKQDFLNLLNEAQTEIGQNIKEPNLLKTKKIAGRNERVSVRYQNGTIKEGVKYKNVEADILSGQCELITPEP